MKIGWGVSDLWGRKSPSPIDKANGLYSSFYYSTSRDVDVQLLVQQCIKFNKRLMLKCNILLKLQQTAG